MTPQPPWMFEPCDPEGATDPAGQPWQHAVRGQKPAGRRVTGYGHTPPAADADARTKASQYDAREVLGERGEIVAPQMANDMSCAALEAQASMPVPIPYTPMFDGPVSVRLRAAYGWRIETPEPKDSPFVKINV